MASLGVGVDSFSVGQISQLLSQSRKRKKESNDKSGLKSLFSISSAVQPVFVPVVEKKKKRKVTEDKITEDKPIVKKKKTNNISNTGVENNESDNEPDSKKTFKKSQEDPERLERTLFVGNIPVTLNKKALKKIFDEHGDVESVRFRSAALAKPNMSRTVGMKKKEFHKDRNTLNGYVVFKSRTQAIDALKSNGKEIEGLHIRVDLAKNDKVHDHSRSVFVGNLQFGIEEEPLREVFKDCGEIESVRLIRDGKTGIGKGFGFITFKEKDSVGFALKLNQTKFKGRPIRVFPSSEHPKKGQVTKVKKDKPPTHSFSGVQAKKNQKPNKPKHMKRKENLGNKKETGKSKGRRTKRSLSYKNVQNKKQKSK